MSQTHDPADGAEPGESQVPEPRSSRSADLAALTEAIRAVERRTPGAPSAPAAARRPEPAPGPAPEPSAEPSVERESQGSADPQPEAPAAAAAASAPATAPGIATAPVAAFGDTSSVAELLAAGGAPAAAVPALAGAALTAFGEGAAQLLREDPWSLLALPGVRPEQADGFARALLGPAAGPGDPRRGQALAGWLLEQAALRGHSALEATELRAGLAKLGLPDPDQALQDAVQDGRVMPFQEEETGPGARELGEDEEPPMRMLLALERLALAEDAAADGLVRLISTFEPAEAAEAADAAQDDELADAAQPDEPADAAQSAESWEAAATTASPSAAALIRAVAANGLVLHTGDAASRGELAELLGAARELRLRARAAAWTEYGRDALADPDSLTLAELLAPGGVERAEDGTLALDLLIVQDAPLLDLELAATLVESLGDGTRLVLSGDPGQLWSTGPGRLFADLLAAKPCPVVASRTPDLGPIGELVSGIGIGELQSVEAPGKEVVILTARDAGEAVHRAVQLLTDSIPRALSIPAEQTVLLTPGHGGAAGTRALNAAAKAALNPGPGRFAGFDPGDRVVYSPLPGVNRPGTVLDGDAAGLRLALTDGAELLLPPAQVDRLRHGWALTVHQALGRRWPGGVVVLPEDAAAGLTRQWVYTAFGRAERHLSVVHAAGPALAQAVAERPGTARTTRLRGLLAEAEG
ncbi:ATP-binding domain-containing protein [Kitasatospora azatica]|uniref:ATP-binding domain-containing protein n=1 Tax=Kitasatospora azatica TaxID=58347 RepID=UPI00068B7AB9|nr:ATP-binding domain-containing protein [Kitasatospora azatica]